MPSNERVTGKHFDKDDVEILEMVVNLIPHLALVASAVKIARQKRLTYPVDTLADLFSASGDRRLLQLQDQKITFEQAQRFWPKEFLPITSERDLLTKLMIAFHRGELLHARENQRMPQAAGDEADVHLPSPTPL